MEKITNTAFFVLFCALGIVALVGAIAFKAYHQFFMVGICVVMCLVLGSELKKLKKAKQ